MTYRNKTLRHNAAVPNRNNEASTNGRLSLIGTGVTRRDATHTSAQNSSTTRVTLSLNGCSSSAPIAYQQVGSTQATPGHENCV